MEMNDILQSESEKVTEKLDVANAMIKFGGSFVQALGQALLQADHINAKKIESAFSEYWIQYLTMSQRKDKEKIFRG